MPPWMLLKSALSLHSSCRRSHCHSEGQAGWKEQELWLLRKLSATFPVLAFPSLKFPAHCRIVPTAVCTCQKVLKEL